jgi:hypothetical protein
MSELRQAWLRLDPFRRKCNRSSGARPIYAHASRRRLELRLRFDLRLSIVLRLRLILGLKLGLGLGRHPGRLRCLPLLAEFGLALCRNHLGFRLFPRAANAGQALEEANLALLRGKSKLRRSAGLSGFDLVLGDERQFLHRGHAANGSADHGGRRGLEGRLRRGRLRLSDAERKRC